MAEMNLQTLLERVSMGQSDKRDMQLIALEQLLTSANVDRCFESCPRRTFLPALRPIFLDECAPENVLEVTARAIPYYLGVSAECIRRIVPDGQLPQCVELLSTQLRHDDSHVADDAVQCFVSITNSMSGGECEAMIDENVLKKLYIFTDNFFDSFTSNLITYFYVLRQFKNVGNQTKAFTIAGRPLSTAPNTFINASEELGKLVNDLEIPKKEKSLKWADLENWTLRVYSKPSTLKKILLQTALDIFQSYEMLFMDNVSEQEMPKYAEEAAKKILKHFISPGGKVVADRATLTNIMTRSENSNKTIIQCCLGPLLTGLFRISPEEKKNSVGKYFSSVGIWHNGQVYINDKSKPKKYFYRRLFPTENNKIPDDYHPSNFHLKMYNYLLDPKDLDNVLVRVEKHFTERDITESKIKEWIDSIKCRISDERQEISTSYRLDVVENLTEAMYHIECIVGKEDEEEKASSVSFGGATIINIENSKIANWNCVF